MRVLFFGSCPLPVEEGFPAQGPGLRTWQLLKPVCEAGHVVLAILLYTEGIYSGDPPHGPKDYPNLQILRFTYDQFTDLEEIEKLGKTFEPDAVVGAASVLPDFVAVKMGRLGPVWADCFGDPLSEIQAKAEIYGKKRCSGELFGVWRYYRAVLATADRFSTLSDAQNHALVGQLALLGRLNFENAGFRLVDTIPCGVEEPGAVPDPSETPSLRGVKFAKDAFVVCFSGSYNTWMDVDFLFEEMEKAMKRLPNLVFLSIGGGTRGYNEQLYDDFCRKVEASGNRERYVLCGWVPFEQVPGYYSEADVGINIDRFSYEGVLWSRNRIVQFLAHGLPVATTPLSEISRRLEAKGHVYCFRMRGHPGSSPSLESLPDLLCRIASDLDALKERGEKGREYVLGEFNFARTAHPLLEWLENPSRAPDNTARWTEKRGEPVYLNEIERFMDYDRRLADITYLSKEKARLDRIRRNPLFRLVRWVKKILPHSPPSDNG